MMECPPRTPQIIPEETVNTGEYGSFDGNSMNTETEF
jgi:hypothetical protein